jgi:hypothetical protein
MKTTLNAIREHSPCADGWKKLMTNLGKTQADDEPLSILEILNSNGLDDAINFMRAVEGHKKEKRLYAVWCARQVQHLMTDPRSLAALDVAERHAHGQATDDELAAAEEGARSAAWAAPSEAAWAAALSAARDAAWSPAAAWAAALSAAWAAALAAPWAAAQAEAWAEARDAQEKQLRLILSQS